jgi:carbon-monoxide dehydrogenase large subunit
VAFEAFTSHDLPEGAEPTLQANSTIDPSTFSFPHGTHLCAVEVDTETGMSTIRKYVCVDDIGNVVNPMIVDGQVHGGLAQGIAQALYEECVYDDAGNLVTGSLVDYLVPAASDLPTFENRPHRDALDHQPAGGQGSRRGRHHRLDPCRGQRGHRRGPTVRRAGHPDGPDPGTSLAGDPRVGLRWW